MGSRQVTKILLTFAAIVLLLAAVGFGFLSGFNYVDGQNKRFLKYDADTGGVVHVPRATPSPRPDGSPEKPDSTLPDFSTDREIGPGTPGAIMIYVQRGDSSSEIAERLFEAGAINSKTLFTMLSKLNGFDGGYQYGTHFVTADMTYDEIMFRLTLPPVTVKVQFREGLTVEQMIAELQKQGVHFDIDEMLRMINNPARYFKYDFLNDIPLSAMRRTRLQGWLFPDTYEFDLNTDAEQILSVILANTNRKLLPEYFDRAEALGMTMDEILTLASIIEKESSQIGEMYKVSRVFHNRLKREARLQSCATVNYLRILDNKPPILIVTSDDMKKSSSYNTYLNAGLPPGPICNPGLEAIRAALYPDTDEPDLYYFCSTGQGTNVFARTISEHEANIRTYLNEVRKVGQQTIKDIEVDEDGRAVVID
ncbi:MAG: endolytic transglycosylase MltG [Clostridiaceae bacterium]|nr:endolytic transglycosylase MltG [Clostridiaceae bacterium]